MKKIILLIFMTASLYSMAQKHSFDTIEFVNGGEVWQLITYDDDSIMLNGIIFRFAGTSLINHWQTFGPGCIQPDPANTILKYPDIPMWNSTIHSMVDAPVWYDYSTKMLRAKTNMVIWIGKDEPDTVTLQDRAEFHENDETATVYIDSLSHINAVTIKNKGINSTLIIKSVEGRHFDGADSVILLSNQWVIIVPDSIEFSVNGNMDAVNNYTKAQADSRFIAAGTRDSLFRYTVYSSGNNNIEVLATKLGITASLANGNEFTFTIPADTDIISAKIRVENFSSVVCIMGGKLQAASMATRWMPVTQAWREDTGQLLTGQTTRMSLTSFSSFTINGLINYTRCHVRITF